DAAHAAQVQPSGQEDRHHDRRVEIPGPQDRRARGDGPVCDERTDPEHAVRRPFRYRPAARVSVAATPRVAAVMGSVNSKVLPAPGVLFTSTDPPWASATVRTIASPRPTPPPSRLLAASDLAKRSKILARSRSAMPTPVSRTAMVAEPSKRRTDNVMESSGPVCLTAFSISASSASERRPG